MEQGSMKPHLSSRNRGIVCNKHSAKQNFIPAEDGSEVINLLDSSGDEDDKKSIALRNEEENKDEEDDDNGNSNERERQHIATCQMQIVGIRFYDGTAHVGEFVTLIREPHHPYDRNAIRVKNMQSQKVGVILREPAATLAPIMDACDTQNPASPLLLEASIPYQGDETFIPVQLDFFAVADTPEALTAHIAKLQGMIHAKFHCKYSLKWKIPFLENSTITAGGHIPSPQVVRQPMMWQAQAQELDKLFDQQSAQQLENLPEIPLLALTKLQTKLMDFQLAGVRWMLSKEKESTAGSDDKIPFYQKIKERGRDMWLCTITNSSQPEPPTTFLGGIQADTMGLGKTLSTLALVLVNPPLTRMSHFYGNNNDEAKMPISHDTKAMVPTANDLSTIPLPKLKRHLSNAGIKVSTKMKKIQVLAIFVEALQKGTIQPIVTSQLCGSVGTSVSSMTTAVCTIIVCPVSVISNWTTQIDTHVESDTLRVGLYQGSRRRDLLTEIQHGMFDILLVSYHTLASEYTQVFGKSKGDRSNSPDDLLDEEPSAKRCKKESIFDINFYRIVLDEGHSIRSSKTTLFKSVCQIQAERKWVLTGTPFVNRCNDLHALFSFLGMPPLNDVRVFNRVITRPMQHGGDDADLAMAQLRTTMAHVALRRSKATAGIRLAEKTVELARIEFENGSAHQILYDALFGSLRLAFQAIFNDQNSDSVGLKIYNSVFERLLRLRQSCCSALLLTQERREVALKMWEYLQQKEAGGSKLTAHEGQQLLEKLKGVFSEEEIQECVICLDEMEQSEAVILKKCQHVFCHPCISKVLSTNASSSKDTCCPLCRQTFQQSDLIKESVATEAAARCEEKGNQKQSSLDDGSIGLSPKILALLEGLKRIKPQEKGVIFSQFTSFLDLIQDAMKGAGHTVTRLDGSMSAKLRMEAVTWFSSDEKDAPRFILCSLHAAGTGINLSRANHAFMMDTWFNESVENQAMDRIHRIGQNRPAFITRFVMKGSIEERMITLQKTKSLQAKGSLQKLKEGEQRKVRLNDLRGLLMLDESNTE